MRLLGGAGARPRQEGLGRGIRDQQLPFTQARQGFEEGMELGHDASFGDKEHLTPACGIAQVRMEFRELSLKVSQGTLGDFCRSQERGHGGVEALEALWVYASVVSVSAAREGDSSGECSRSSRRCIVSVSDASSARILPRSRRRRQVRRAIGDAVDVSDCRSAAPGPRRRVSLPA
ncbi:hypothetical protein [Ktedonospora formicarum]|uniref:hypothetical protein n=1 Tax=Ktedonospora formicarum TaxID=2778364 RepID=UPI001C688BAF|nr:hypothetical protein [Ktedonospora formicarum]